MTNTKQVLPKLDPSDYVYSEQTETFSTWKNNNSEKAVFRLLTHLKKPGKHPKFGADCKGSVFLRVEIEPGATKQLPSEYDQAIRAVSPVSGQVVGGLCPWLTKVGEEDVVVHTSLDYKTALMEEEAKLLAASLKKENELRDALAELEKRKLSDKVEKEQKKTK
jgi:hypothetical protein